MSGILKQVEINKLHQLSRGKKQLNLPFVNLYKDMTVSPIMTYNSVFFLEYSFRKYMYEHRQIFSKLIYTVL